MLYVWLNCEGWKRYGPFRHISVVGTAVVDENGSVIASREGDFWRTPDLFVNYCWRSLMVTASEDDHPHPNRGAV